MMDLRLTLLVAGGSACSFKLLNVVVGLLPAPQLKQTKAWKWRNISTSLAHSMVTGAWAGLCLYLRPQMVEDLVSSRCLLSHCLVAVSTGYFIHDFVDMALNQLLKESWELLLHHCVVISCFSLAVTSRLYVGFAVVSLLVEINSVFLHVRQLLLLLEQGNRPRAGVTAPRRPVTYSVISWLNMGTFLVFRVCTLAWMSRWLAGHSERVPRPIVTLGAAGLSVVSATNAALFYRLVRADVLKNTRSKNRKREAAP